MRVIIAGISETGGYIAKYLVEEGFDVTVIDINAVKVREISDNESAVAGIVGDITDIETLKIANIATADILIATTDSDEQNIIACQLAHYYKVNYKICKLSGSKYQHPQWKELLRNKIIPIDDTISIGVDLVRSISQQIKYSHMRVSNVMDFTHNNLVAFSIFCDEDSRAVNKTVSSLYEDLDEGIPFKILAIRKNNTFHIATNEDIISENDKVFIILDTKYIDQIYELFFSNESSKNRILDNQSPNIVVSGDHPFVKVLAIQLASKYNRVKVITDCENEIDNNLLAMDLEKHGIQLIVDDITKSEYRNHYIKSEDDIVILMNLDDNTNILKALFLRYQGVGNIFCFLNDESYENFLLSNKIHRVFSFSYFIMSSLLSYIRRGVVMNAYSLANKAEIIELVVTATSKLAGKKIEEIENGNKLLVAAVIDDRHAILAVFPEMIIRSDYTIIVVGTRRYLREMENALLQIDN